MVSLREPIGVVVGLVAEGRLAAPFGCQIEAGGGTARGAVAAVSRLVAAGARGLLSFGLAGGLDPSLRAGTVIVPEAVIVLGNAAHPVPLPVDFALASALGGPTRHTLFAGTDIAATVEEKRRLHAQSGAAAIDLESGAVAQAAAAHGLPFAVLRAICDPAERNLPPAALAALDQTGGIRAFRIIGSIAHDPRQIAALLALASDAAAARRALIGRVAAIGQISTST